MQPGILPSAIPLLGPVRILGDDTAQDAAITGCLVALGATGLLVARAAGARGILVAVSGAIPLCIGVVLIVLRSSCAR